MKRIITICLLLAGLMVKAQTLEQKYNANLSYTKLSATEDAFYYYDKQSKVLKVFSTNHALIKSININVDDSIGLNVTFVTKSLFNNDNKIKYGFTSYNGKGKYRLHIIDENGQIIFQKDSAYSPLFYNTSSGLKMVINSTNAINTFCEVYSISGVYLGKKEQANDAIDYLPYPNPTFNNITLLINNKTLSKVEVAITDINGQLVDRILTSGDVDYNSSNLPSGLYFYSVNGVYAGKFVKQ